MGPETRRKRWEQLKRGADKGVRNGKAVAGHVKRAWQESRRSGRAKDVSQQLRTYSNLSQRRHQTKDQRIRQKAAYLTALPKSPIKRWRYRLSPKHFFSFWFSREGFITALRLTGIGIALMIVLTLGVFAYFRGDLPDPKSVRYRSQTTKFYDRTGKVLLYEVYGDQNRTVVEIDQISNYAKWATVAIEDKDFYRHGGFSVSGIIRAGVSNVFNRGGLQQGGSTLTQQFIKNSLLTSERTFTRKIKELILAIELERNYSKDEILSFYLNEIPYGSQEYGVEAASQSFFGKPAAELTIDEAAMLAALPQAPTYYSPYGDNTEDLTGRQHYVIDQMREQGYITQEEADKAKAAKTLKKVVPLSKRSLYTNIKAPHFVLEVQRRLEAQYGASIVQTGGLKIITTLDWKKQRAAERAVKNNIGAVTAQNGDNIALTAVDNKNSQILAMVGSRDFRYPKYGSYNAATSLRQPGSSIKVCDYAELFKNSRWGAGSMIYDTPTSFFGWRPNNFDRRFRGKMTLREALGESRNIPAIKAGYIAGIENVAKLCQKMGDKSLVNTGNLSLAIGAAEVRLSEHTNMYSTIARGGIYKPEAYVLKIENANGEVLEEWQNTNDRVLDEQIAYMLTDILQDDNARVRTFGARNPDFYIPGLTTASKTGTTDEARDGWMMGYSRYYTVGVWVGNHDNRAMNSVTARQTGPTWTAFMREIHSGKKNRPIFDKAPDGIKRIAMDRDTGFAASDRTRNRYVGIFPSWYKPERSGSSSSITIDTVSGKIATECTPPRARESTTAFGLWPEIDRSDPAWSYFAPSAGYSRSTTAPKEKDDVHDCDDRYPTVQLSVSPTPPYQVGDTVTLSAVVRNGTHRANRLNFKVNGQTVSAKNISGNGTYEYEYTFTNEGSTKLGAEVIDNHLYDDDDSETFTVDPADGDTTLNPSTNGRFWRRLQTASGR